MKPGGEETVTADFPHEESERGFMTLLRQFVHAPEPASFKNVQAIAQRVDSASGSPNAPMLANWGRYHKKLLARTPDAWASIKAHEGLTTPLMFPGHDAPRVDRLLQTYFYGDIIHFGEGRDDLESLSKDTFARANNRMLLYKGPSALAMFYMGYAEVMWLIHT